MTSNNTNTLQMERSSAAAYSRLIITIFAIAVLAVGLFFLLAGSSGKLNRNDGSAVTPPQTESENFYIAYQIPENVYFAGEAMPVEYFDVRESLDREMLINAYWHSATMQTLKLSARYFPVIEPILKKNGIPDDFKYLAVAESGLRNLTSPAGAKGYWQILSKTATSYGLEVSATVDQRYDLEKSTEAACKYLNSAYKKFGNWTLAAASYNAGMTGVSSKVDAQKVSSYYDLYLNSETARYIFRIVAFKLIFENPDKFGFKLAESDKYHDIATTSIQVDATINSLVDFALLHKTNYKVLKQLNPWLVDEKLVVATGKSYTIQLPENNSRSLNF